MPAFVSEPPPSGIICPLSAPLRLQLVGLTAGVSLQAAAELAAAATAAHPHSQRLWWQRHQLLQLQVAAAPAAAAVVGGTAAVYRQAMERGLQLLPPWQH